MRDDFLRGMFHSAKSVAMVGLVESTCLLPLCTRGPMSLGSCVSGSIEGSYFIRFGLRLKVRSLYLR